jgi:hypothetical protein
MVLSTPDEMQDDLSPHSTAFQALYVIHTNDNKKDINFQYASENVAKRRVLVVCGIKKGNLILILNMKKILSE